MRTQLYFFTFVAVLLGLSSAKLAAQEEVTYINPRTVNESGGPFSGAVLAGNTLYISGTLGLDADGEVPAAVDVEARNVLNNIRGQLQDAGMTMDDLVLVQVYCSDVAFYDTFNEVYRTYFSAEFPARAFLGSGTLLRGARFEVMGIAVDH
ncbi:MAG TPA: RidA family protein [Gemmatimonadetes bacterium]|jgi:2-iminobutanoate/2-iminopropanoate deaminase|nr:RidA family protein [Gemmatimonadota bacterium]|tara:strand:+ start:17714 stop:18166 length:453 start_codon:yes stop_codon:yes gene_type:complete